MSNVVDRIYRFNHGYADCACCIFYNNQEFYFYLKEIGNNKGYSMGQKVYEFDRTSFCQFKNEQFDRESLSKYICDLPQGDQDWLDNEDFVKSLINYISQKSVCANNRHHF